MVPSKGEDHLKEMHSHVRKPIIQTESADNQTETTTETLSPGDAAADRAEEAAAVAAAEAADQNTKSPDTITNGTPS